MNNPTKHPRVAQLVRAPQSSYGVAEVAEFDSGRAVFSFCAGTQNAQVNHGVGSFDGCSPNHGLPKLDLATNASLGSISHEKNLGSELPASTKSVAAIVLPV